MSDSVRGCGLCGSSAVEPLHTMRFSLPVESPLPSAYDVVACLGCGFVFADTSGTQGDYDAHYTDFSRYEDATVASSGGESEHDAARLQAAAEWVSRHVAPASRMADVGSGSGGLLDALAARGFRDLTGIELAPGCLEQLTARGHGARSGSVRDLPADLAGSFDVVLLSHVMEHVVDLRASMLSATSLLRPGGLLYIETPDASRYAGRSMAPFYFFDPEHINHFDIARHTALCALAGLSVIASGQRDFVLPSGDRYPAAFVLARLDSRPTPHTAQDRSLASAVSAYVAESRTRDKAPGLDAALTSGRPLALWGAGSEGQRLLGRMGADAARLVAVVDRDRTKQGRSLAGCVITPPETGLRDLPVDTVLLVAAALVAPKIAAEYTLMGLPYPLVFPWEEWETG